MSVPCLAQAGKLTGERRYYDDAAKQILQFADRMFVKDKGLFMHAWVQDMQYPSGLPLGARQWLGHHGHGRVAGGAAGGPSGPAAHPGAVPRARRRPRRARRVTRDCWHQLLDRRESYEETSASAMFVFAIARGINRGWLDAPARSVPRYRWAGTRSCER